MASLDNLLLSWNFDSLTNNTSAEVNVLDTVNSYTGKGSLFITKDSLKINKKLLPDVINGVETIQIREDDDPKVDFTYKKPSSIQATVENSMYQIISEEMLRMFSSITDYAFQYSEARHKYLATYEGIDNLRRYFFKRVNNKPDIEKYLEFYKWLDSSLGYMLEQLLPENSGNKNGLKPIIESHILERNKYQYKLPLRLQSNSVFGNKDEEKITVTSDKILSSSTTIETIKQENQIKVIRIDTANQTFDTAGKSINHRNGRSGKGVMQTLFSSADGSETGEEMSLSNALLNRNRTLVDRFNLSQSKTTNIQGGLDVSYTECSPGIPVLDETKTTITINLQPLSGYMYTGSYNDETDLLDPSIPGGATWIHRIRVAYVPAYTLEQDINFQNYKNLFDENTGGLKLGYVPNITSSIFPSIPFLTQTYYLKKYNAGDSFEISDYNDPLVFTEDSYVIYRNFDRQNVSTVPPGAEDPVNKQATYDINFLFNLYDYTINQDEECVPVDLGYQFADNNFISRNIPYLDINYTNKQNVNYQNIPDANVEKLRNSNFYYTNLLSHPNDEYLREPPIQYNIPVFQKLKVQSAVQDIDVLSPYSTKVEKFSPEMTKGIEDLMDQSPDALKINYGNIYSDEELNNTFLNKTQKYSDLISLKYLEKLDNIFPSKNYVGSAETRTKPEYEEIEGEYNTSSVNWNDNSYNNNSALIRSFWNSNQTLRRRKTPTLRDSFKNSGSFNCLNGKNEYIEEVEQIISSSDNNAFLFAIIDEKEHEVTADIYADRIQYDSVYCLDSNIKYKFNIKNGIHPKPYLVLTASNSIIGDIAPHSHWSISAFIGSRDRVNRAKPEFIHNVYPGWYTDISGSDRYLNFIFNNSYQNGPDNKLNPKYDTYLNYFENIKHLSQNRSILPEYAISNYDELILGNKNYFYGSTKNYIKYLGTEKFSLNRDTASHIVNFNKFINTDSNKIKIKISGIKKLLPYNGFYPSQRSVQVIEKFDKCYTRDLNISAVQKQALIQPFFGPGILFNTIKSGIGTNFPIFSPDHTNDYTNWLTSSNPDNLVDDTLYVLNKISKDVQFEALLEPKQRFFNELKDGYLAYLNPTHYSKIFFPDSNFGPLDNPYVEIGSIIKSLPASDFEYRLSINNFLSEIPNFFLKDNKLTYLNSLPENDFNTFNSGSVYAMRLEIEKKQEFSMFKSFIQNTRYELPIQSVFGPPVNNGNASIFEANAYQPYSPPYYNNSSYVDVVFIPNETKKYTLEEIFGKSQLLTSSLESNISNNNRMLISDCLNIFQKANDKQLRFDTVSGFPIETTNSTNYKWVIQTKMETPLINYPLSSGSSQQVLNFKTNYIKYITEDIRQTFDLGVKVINNHISGIWDSLGAVPIDNQGIELRAVDVPGSASLADACGFPKVSPKSIGVLADSKKINEAVVLLPYVNADFGDYSTVVFNDAEDRFLFKIDESAINRVLGVTNYASLTIQEIKEIVDKKLTINRENSIFKLIKGMVNYNIPPHLNWIYDKNIKPFVMYIVEFEHILDKQDLANIWQGTLPKIGTHPEEQTVTFEHFITDDELMFGTDINNIARDYQVEMSVFKVKARANRNYYELTADVGDGLKYRFGGEEQIPWYSYNWPYDYFSLVELVNVQAGEVFDANIPVAQEIMPEIKLLPRMQDRAEVINNLIDSIKKK
jgi:hypothetical protein